MKLNYTPLLKVQRELHGIPRGPGRFTQYLRTMLSADGTDVDLAPLVAINPMARDHVTALLDALLAMDADAIAAQAAAQAAADLDHVPGEWSVATIVADDLLGSGTNRFACEFELRFGPEKLRLRKPKRGQRQWLTGVLWSSEAPGESAIRQTILAAAHRAAWQHAHGPVRTLADMLAQEGHVMARAGCTLPALDDEEIEYTRAVLAPCLNAPDQRTAIECLFGDAAARSLGLTPRGLSPWAGLSLALYDARCAPAS
ncbi:MAG: hypothetical protein L0211_12505 [Planctomycetaceae bacterium]|nr:hypothetical protein [Planctomycetaceae bacterium]